MLKQISEKYEIQLSIAHKVFPLPVIERTLFLLRDQITGVEVTDNTSEKIQICISVVPTDALQDMEDTFYSKLISTAVFLTHEENSREIKQDFIQTAMRATTEPQYTLKGHLILLRQKRIQFSESRSAYWDQYSGYRVELGGGFDIFAEEDVNTFHLDLDDSFYSLTHVQLVVEKMDADSFRCTIGTENSRIIVSLTFQNGVPQGVMLKTLLDLHKHLRI